MITHEQNNIKSRRKLTYHEFLNTLLLSVTRSPRKEGRLFKCDQSQKIEIRILHAMSENTQFKNGNCFEIAIEYVA